MMEEKIIASIKPVAYRRTGLWKELCTFSQIEITHLEKRDRKLGVIKPILLPSLSQHLAVQQVDRFEFLLGDIKYTW